MVRRALAVALFGILWLLAVGTVRAQQPDQGPKVVEAQKLKDNLHVLTVGGGNSAVFSTSQSVVVVDIDTKLPGLGSALQDKIKTLTDKAEFIIRSQFKKETDGSTWNPRPCEIPSPLVSR